MRTRAKDVTAAVDRGSRPGPGTPASGAAPLGLRAAGNRAVAGVLAATGPTVQRAMGMEIEIRRAIATSSGEKIAGDRKLVNHADFTLVSDKRTSTRGVKYSNLEFVMKHFDQLGPAEGAAVAELRRRLAAMKALRDLLYASKGQLTRVTGARGNPHSPYDSPAGTRNLMVGKAPGHDDGSVYVQYTVGFEPAQWRRMLVGAHNAGRSDTGRERPKAHIRAGLEESDAVVGALAGAITAEANRRHIRDTRPIVTELKGHLALVYMQMVVFVERTLDLQLSLLRRERSDLRDEKRELDARLAGRPRRRKRSHDEVRLEEVDDRLAALRAQITALKAQLGFKDGQPKNKIAMLPRAGLKQARSALSKVSRVVLKTNKDGILNAFAAALERRHSANFVEGLILRNKVGEQATLLAYVSAGLDGAEQISQQVLFGGMKETGIDTTSTPHLKLLPFEFRSLFKAEIPWAEMEADAVRVLKWSRDPRHAAALRPPAPPASGSSSGSSSSSG